MPIVNSQEEQGTFSPQGVNWGAVRTRTLHRTRTAVVSLSMRTPDPIVILLGEAVAEALGVAS